MKRMDQNEKNMQLYFDDLKRPDAIVNAQKDVESNSVEGKEQNYYPRVSLFFSFDIVNSTMYKSVTGNWPIIIRGLLEDIRSRVFKMPDLAACNLWRVIGDEMIFVMPIYSLEEIGTVLDSIFEVLQRMTKSLKSGKFFESLVGQAIQKNDIEMLKIQTPLSIKSAAWIAVINDKVESPYECIKFNYSASSQNQIITEYLGRDIDAGFRLKAYTQDRRLVVSFELAYFLFKLDSGRKSDLFIMDYVRLKGVWNETLYPIIWFHNAKVMKDIYNNSDSNYSGIQFANSFRYDETDKNELVNRYFARGKQNRKKNKRESLAKNEYLLADSMFKVESALDKIRIDRNLEDKIIFIRQLLEREALKSSIKPYANPLEVHCAVVCCNVEQRKVMIMHRGQQHSTNPNKWEFGCAKLSSEKKLISSVTEYYKDTFGIEIQLVMDTKRTDIQPVPIAIYELKSDENIKKGIIFVAKVTNDLECDKFRAEKSHDKIRWIGKEEIDRYKDDAVPDFEDTLCKVFDQFDSLFDSMEEE